MRTLSYTLLSVSLLVLSSGAMAQTKSAGKPSNIYKIKQAFLQEDLHNPAEKEEDGEDNDLARFNRWFNFVEPRCYPSGNLPAPNVLLKAYQAANKSNGNIAQKTTAGRVWKPYGPTSLPSNHNGIGRVNVIAVDKQDTATLIIGTACGGVWVSHNSGATWFSNTDNFPSLSIADIAINPKHLDTVYAATGDGYGYENGGYNIFWGGLYSAGIMMSTDTGRTWRATGLSYLQSDRDIIQKILIHPRKTNTLLAATRNGLLRSTDAGSTWATVTTGHIYSIAFKPNQPDTVYAINNSNFLISYDAGATWTVRYAGINSAASRCTIGVTPASNNSVWVLTSGNTLMKSVNMGQTFATTGSSPATTASFWGYYDRVLAISPTDTTTIYALGKNMAKSTTGGNTWANNDPTFIVHVDYHAFTFNPLRINTQYCGNDGGISVSRSGGNAFTNISNGLMISQLYAISTSAQDTDIMLAGLQDNGTFAHDNTPRWLEKYGGDGMDNAIAPYSDYVQIAAYQYGAFAISYDQGVTFSDLTALPTRGTAAWVAPVVITPRTTDTMFFGMKDIYATYDGGITFTALTSGPKFSGGAVSLAVAPASNKYIYAANNSNIIRTTNGGATWTDISAGLPSSSLAITGIAVDYKVPTRLYVSVSGYTAGRKVYYSNDSGRTWTNFSNGLPNLPANCLAVDSSQPGGIFVGTDMGVYYRDSSDTAWRVYNPGLPNVIVNDLDINYKNYKIKAGTYGRGIWECGLIKNPPVNETKDPNAPAPALTISPNPTTQAWKLNFLNAKPASFTVNLWDMAGRKIATYPNAETIDAGALSKGAYQIEVIANGKRDLVKAVKF